tara:strand:+ start:1761 stop:2033 length:273 start_codon:yes stop_codon:yes gene_type:complete
MIPLAAEEWGAFRLQLKNPQSGGVLASLNPHSLAPLLWSDQSQRKLKRGDNAENDAIALPEREHGNDPLSGPCGNSLHHHFAVRGPDFSQ